MKTTLGAQSFSSDFKMTGFTKHSSTIDFISQACKPLLANVAQVTWFPFFALYTCKYGSWNKPIPSEECERSRLYDEFGEYIFPLHEAEYNSPPSLK